MRFFDYNSDSRFSSDAETEFWEALKRAFENNEQGIAFRDYKIRGNTGTVAHIDFLVVHPELGILIFEVKSTRINQIKSIDDTYWNFFNSKSIKNPLRHIDNLMWMLHDIFRGRIDPSSIPTQSYLVLPNINKTQWRKRGFDRVQSRVILSTDLSVKNLLKKLRGGIEATIGGGFRENWEIIEKLFVQNKQAADSQKSKISKNSENDVEKGIIGKYERDKPSIFISYRRKDSAWAVRHIAGYLTEIFGNEVYIFLDVDSIDYGQRFDKVIEEEIQKTNAIIVVIGNEWLKLSHDNGMRRLDDPKDYVVKEISYALDLNKEVIPVLLDDVSMPDEKDLPFPLKTLTLQHAMTLTTDTFKNKMDNLVMRLRILLELENT